MCKLINCPKCNKQTTVILSKALDELGEVFMCTHCDWKFSYVDK